MIGIVVKSEKSKGTSLFKQTIYKSTFSFSVIKLSLEWYLHTIVLAEFTEIRNNQFKWLRCITAFTAVF